MAGLNAIARSGIYQFLQRMFDDLSRFAVDLYPSSDLSQKKCYVSYNFENVFSNTFIHSLNMHAHVHTYRENKLLPSRTFHFELPPHDTTSARNHTWHPS